MVTPSRGRCLVQRVETQESYGGSKIVLPDVVRDRIASQQVEILAVGEPVLCDDEWCDRVHNEHPVGDEWLRYHPTGHMRPGDWVLVAPRSLVECGDPTGKTFLVRQDDVIAVLEG